MSFADIKGINIIPCIAGTHKYICTDWYYQYTYRLDSIICVSYLCLVDAKGSY